MKYNNTQFRNRIPEALLLVAEGGRTPSFGAGGSIFKKYSKIQMLPIKVIDGFSILESFHIGVEAEFGDRVFAMRVSVERESVIDPSSIFREGDFDFTEIGVIDYQFHISFFLQYFSRMELIL